MKKLDFDCIMCGYKNTGNSVQEFLREQADKLELLIAKMIEAKHLDEGAAEVLRDEVVVALREAGKT